jgi:outer membrane receptor for ferrienterochelin and colicins
LPKYLFNILLKHSFEKSNFIIFILINTISFAQTTIKGTVTADGMPLQMANIVLKNEKSTITTANGSYHFDGVPMGTMKLPLPTGFKSQTQRITITDTTTIILDFNLRDDTTLDEL